MLSAKLGVSSRSSMQSSKIVCAQNTRPCARHPPTQRRSLLPRLPSATPAQRSSHKQVRAPPCHAVIEKMDAKQLEVAIAERDRPLIIDFYATWCGPCVLLSQELEKLAKEIGDKVRIVKVDVDENQSLSSQLQIQGLPTMVFVDVKSKPALRTEGLLPLDTIKDILRNELQVQL